MERGNGTLGSHRFHIQSAPRRFDKAGDLWADMLKKDKSFPSRNRSQYPAPVGLKRRHLLCLALSALSRVEGGALLFPLSPVLQMDSRFDKKWAASGT